MTPFLCCADDDDMEPYLTLHKVVIDVADNDAFAELAIQSNRFRVAKACQDFRPKGTGQRR